MRQEKDSLGTVEVPDDRLYGAQTMRSLHNFTVGDEKMPMEVIYAFGFVKKASAQVNLELGLLEKEQCDLITDACDTLLEGKLDQEFPLYVWQTGSGTQSNMNVNEVISNYCIKKVGGTLGSKDPIHPNDHVNKSQSSNDTFPTAMHIAAKLLVKKKLLPALVYLKDVLHVKAQAFESIIKTGRTHLMDAVPLTLGQEFSGYVAQLERGIQAIENALPHVSEIALGGTAVGTGLNSDPQYAEKVAKKLSELTGETFVTAPNKFEALAASDAMVELSGALTRVSASLLKIGNDIRWMGSGPRCGLGELKIPANEPGSSIMPGKVNPTQCESLTMVCAQVHGNNATVSFAGSQGNFELNVFRPVIIYNVIQSIKLLADSSENFAKHCAEGLEANKEQLSSNVERSLMLATALNTVIGYDKAAQIVKKAFSENTSLKEAAVSLGFMSEDEFIKAIDPAKMC